MSLLIKSLQGIPLGTTYTVWTGIGAVGTVRLGIFVSQDLTSFRRLFFLAMLVGSVVGLRIAPY